MAIIHDWENLILDQRKRSRRNGNDEGTKTKELLYEKLKSPQF